MTQKLQIWNKDKRCFLKNSHKQSLSLRLIYEQEIRRLLIYAYHDVQNDNMTINDKREVIKMKRQKMLKIILSFDKCLVVNADVLNIVLAFVQRVFCLTVLCLQK